MPDAACCRRLVVQDMVLGYVKDFQDTDGDKAADYLLLMKPLARARKLIEALLEATDESGLQKLTNHLRVSNSLLLDDGRCYWRAVGSNGSG